MPAWVYIWVTIFPQSFGKTQQIQIKAFFSFILNIKSSHSFKIFKLLSLREVFYFVVANIFILFIMNGWTCLFLIVPIKERTLLHATLPVHADLWPAPRVRLRVLLYLPQIPAPPLMTPSTRPPLLSMNSCSQLHCSAAIPGICLPKHSGMLFISIGYNISPKDNSNLPAGGLPAAPTIPWHPKDIAFSCCV